MKSDLELQIIDLSRGGAGVARQEEGRVVFVPWTAPGDHVRVQIEEEHKNYSKAKLIQIVKKSSLRQEPLCPVFQQCGGCQWQHLPYALQWQTKWRGLVEVLTRAHLVAPMDEIPATQIWNYRNRIQLHGHQKELGFYAARSHEIIPIQQCWIARAEINQTIASVRESGEKKHEPFQVEIEVLDNQEVRTTWDAQRAELGFRQVHTLQNQKLQHWVQEELRHCVVLYDLFGGAGNFSLFLQHQMQEVHCVDWNIPSPRPNHLSHVYFHQEDVEKWLSHFRRSSVLGDQAAILDPPRCGLGRSRSRILQDLKRLGVQNLVLVGCHLDAWIRDLRGFLQQGWQLQRVAGLDFFPQTPHLECVAFLRLIDAANTT